jgi:hypothetical protein
MLPSCHRTPKKANATQVAIAANNAIRTPVFVESNATWLSGMFKECHA